MYSMFVMSKGSRPFDLQVTSGSRMMQQGFAAAQGLKRQSKELKEVSKLSFVSKPMQNMHESIRNWTSLTLPPELGNVFDRIVTSLDLIR